MWNASVNYDQCWCFLLILASSIAIFHTDHWKHEELKTVKDAMFVFAFLFNISCNNCHSCQAGAAMVVKYNTNIYH